MDRRTFIRVLSALGAAPLGASAQPVRKLWRIGYLTPTGRAEIGVVWTQLTEALREMGYIEGSTLSFEARTAEDDLARLPSLANELVESKVDLIVAVSPPAIRAASRATRIIPIVMAFWGGEGLVESGIVASFAHPGGNVTGIYMLADELEGKRLELLLRAVPHARRIAVLNPGPRVGEVVAPEVREVAQAAKTDLSITEVPGPNGYEAVFESMRKERIDAVLVPSFPRFYLERLQIIEAAAKQRIPAIYEWGDMARAGGLIAYGPVNADLQRRVAVYVDRILRGAKPGDLPVEQPTKFELVINLNTAKAIGLAVPQSLLLRADEVIQ
jgi:putative ABC transport system substrate-binding protein